MEANNPLTARLKFGAKSLQKTALRARQSALAPKPKRRQPTRRFVPNPEQSGAVGTLPNAQSRGKDMARSAAASGPAKRKGRRRPKLEQMPPDTFGMQSMEPVMSPFAWSNNPDVPNSITPRDMLGDPKNSFGDLLTPNGTNLNLFSPSGMDFAEDYEDL